jgi:stage III sporulation protein AE
VAWAAAATAVTEPLLPEAPLSDAERLLEQLQRDLGVELPKLGLRDLVAMLRGTGGGPDLRALGAALGAYFGREVYSNLHLLGRFLALVVLLGLLSALKSAFGSESVGRTAYFVGAVVLAGMAISGLHMAVSAAQANVRGTVDFMRGMFPILLSLLIAVGGVATAGLFSSWMLFATYAMALVANGIVIPLAIAGAACELVSVIGGEVRITRLASVLRLVGTTVLGLTLTLFLGVMTVQSAAGSVADGVALRTGKFLASSFIPIVGKLFGDAVEMVIGGALIVKSVVGIAGMLAVFVVTAVPALKVAALILIYRLAGAIAQPVAGGPVVACLEGVANSLVLILLAVCGTGLAWFVSIAMIMGAGNAAVMLR